MRVTILNAKKTLYEGNAKEVILPGEDGEFSVLDFHQTFLYSLTTGVIRIIASIWEEEVSKTTSKKLSQVRINISKGIAKMVGNELVVMV
ncbi:MAG: hypothetical protein JSV34_05420 [Candidatus Omnitrophota bacterium]|nr:MAG: hypothetical protein JSV34_05420 [Candidatus Omnitrophota bacterium]